MNLEWLLSLACGPGHHYHKNYHHTSRSCTCSTPCSHLHSDMDIDTRNTPASTTMGIKTRARRASVAHESICLCPPIWVPPICVFAVCPHRPAEVAAAIVNSSSSRLPRVASAALCAPALEGVPVGVTETISAFGQKSSSREN